MPVTLIGESVFARCLSSLKSERMEASKVLKGPASSKYTGDKKQFIDHIKKVTAFKWCIIIPLQCKPVCHVVS